MNFKITLFIISLIFLTGCSDEKIIELPLSFQEGYGPFQPSMAGVSPYSKDEGDPWKNTHLEVSGIPEGWTDIKVGNIYTDKYQSTYQSFHNGTITEEVYKDVQKKWNWEPDSLNLSKKPIKSKIAFVYGKDSLNETRMIVDANNNKDFSDDRSFAPIEIDFRPETNYDSLMNVHAINVDFERYVNNEIIPAQTPLLIAYFKQFGMFMHNFAQYATTNLDGEEIAIASNNFLNLSYDNLGITLLADSVMPGKKLDGEQVVLKDEYIKIKNDIYKNLGVKKSRNVLVLEKMDESQDQLRATQIGYKALEFSGKQFKKQKSVSLDDLQGKYVLIDFWATWCVPCIQEIPNLKELYEDVDKSQFEIVSIVGDSSEEDLERLINEHSIQWPQIISNDTNKIKENYGISAYPTTFLLNPEGQIIAKNLRGNELESKVTALLNK